MPLYEYECEQGHKHERVRLMAECSEDSFCPECKQEAKRILSNFGSATPLDEIIVLQEHFASEGGGYTKVGRIPNAPRTQPPIPPNRNLIEV